MAENSPRVPKGDDRVNNGTTEADHDSKERKPELSSPTFTAFTALQSGPLSLRASVTAAEVSRGSFAIEGTLTPPPGPSNPDGLSYNLQGTITPRTPSTPQFVSPIASTPRRRFVDPHPSAKLVSWGGSDEDEESYQDSIPASRRRGRPRGSRGRGRAMMTQTSSHLPPSTHSTTPHTFAPTSNLSRPKRSRAQSSSSSGSDDSMKFRFKKKAKDSNGDARSAPQPSSSRSSMFQPSGNMQTGLNSSSSGGHASTPAAASFSHAIASSSISSTQIQSQEPRSPGTIDTTNISPPPRKYRDHSQGEESEN